jgi:polyphenol oxidase
MCARERSLTHVSIHRYLSELGTTIGTMHTAAPAIVFCSELLSKHGFAHGFSTRNGGVSDGNYTSLNLGGAVGDDPECVRENHRRLADTVKYDPVRLHQTSQVHGRAVFVPGESAEVAESVRCEADGLVARYPGMAVAVRVADCVPVLLGSKTRGWVAAVHAGWRGVAQKILSEAVTALQCDGSDLVAAVGPSIGPCCFEVGEEVAEELSQVTGPEVIVRSPTHSKPHVNLWKAVEIQLKSLGIRDIDLLQRCTRCEAQHFFSFRRDGQKSGRMVGVIVAREVTKTS